MGPLVTTSWTVELQLPFRIFVNERELGSAAARRKDRDMWETTHQSGRPDEPEIHGTLALLQLPADFVQEYPDIMVRCNKHGDAILDRLQLIAWLRGKPAVRKITVGMPRLKYELPRQDGGTTTHHERRRRFRGVSPTE
jgi:hypothetical protein